MMAVCYYGYEETLLSRCIMRVVECLPSLMDAVDGVPSSLKERILFLMQKRGLVSDQNISKVLGEKVRDLDLSECEISDHALITIASRCCFLKKIDLNSLKSSRIAVTTQGIVSLAHGCRHLQVVYLRRCINVTDEAVIALAQCCPRLRDLNVGGCSQLTDNALRALGQHSASLASINFSFADVSDSGVFCIARGACSASLQEVHMVSCQLVTDEAIEAITLSCPKINILIFHGCPQITERSRVSLEQVLGLNSQMKQLTWTVY